MSGIEGNYRITCENVMRVLRENKDSLMAVLEAFVHDPLINWWRSTTDSTKVVVVDDGENDEEGSVSGSNANLVRFDGEKNDHTNPRALAVITRVSNKLTGMFTCNTFKVVTLNILKR